MVNEHYDGQEEGEYHFSDDQANYEMEMDGSKGAPVVTATNKEGMLARLKSRNVVVGLIVFGSVLAGVYKYLGPTDTQPTDFQQPAITAAPDVKPPVPTPVAAKPVQTQPVVPVASPIPTPVATAPTQPVAPSAPAPAVEVTPTLTERVLPPSSQPAIPTASPTNEIQARLASLEQSESSVVNLLQNQYVQKTELEAQNTQVRAKLDELNTRIANMENTFRQLTQMLRTKSAAKTSRSLSSVPPRPVQPRIRYSVQAIIPGRAWLKSDNGETITVAEGDTLKGYGRISRIDPYDGVVDIDLGNKVVTLSYGAS